MTEKKVDFLHNLHNTLRFHQAMGIKEYPKTPDIQRFLKMVKGPGVETVEQPESICLEPPSPEGMDNLEVDIRACTMCRLSRDPLGKVPGKGKTGCRLMIVGDWSSQSGTFSPATLFGKDEDAMLWKMMAAIGLHPDQVYVTNSLKCCPKDTEIIDSKCEESCFSFLTREIAAVNPHIICAMGEMSVQMLMGRKEPLARLRGRFGNYRYQSGRTVMVMPTFHPRFLLQHQEMKKATWNDLLLIKRRFDES